METKPKGKNAKKKPFKQTRQLINLALNDGWTQVDIAEKCRVHQSVVSGWKKGTKEAAESTLMPLLEIYGHKLRRNSFRVYWARDPETLKPTFHKVEGKVILSQSFSDPRRKNYKLIKKIPVYKLVIHDQGKGKFRVIQQNRLTFRGSNEELECSQEDAIWNSIVGDQMDAAELIDFVDTYCKEQLNKYPSDANTLPYLIRKALLNYGYHLDGVVEYPAVW
jgi:transcriptional regulator with XRE-family HTH domain